MIVKKKAGYFVLSEKTKRNLGGSIQNEGRSQKEASPG